MTRSVTALLLLGLAACATTEGYENVLKSWVGSREIALVASWGAPHRVYEAGNGDRALTYYNERTVSVPLDTGAVIPVEYSCETTFIVVDGVVDSWSYRGNDCVQ